MNRIRFSCQQFLHFFCQFPRFHGTGEEEYLFFPAQIGQEADGFFLPLFIEADEDIVENDRHRFDLFGKGHGQTHADGQIYLVARAAAPFLFGNAPARPVDGIELPSVKTGLERIPALGHEVEIIAGLADYQRLANPFVIILGFAEHILGIQEGQPVIGLPVEFRFPVLLFLQQPSRFFALCHLTEPFDDAASLFGHCGQFLFRIGYLAFIVCLFVFPGLAVVYL